MKLIHYHPAILTKFNSKIFENYVDKFINCKNDLNRRYIKIKKRT